MKTPYRSLIRTISLLLAFSVVFNGCPDNDNPITPSNSKLELGTETPLSQTQQSAGSVIAISKPGNPLNGMSITIPDDAFAGSRAFTLTSFEIKSHKFGSNVNPISPLIRVTSSGGYANGIYQIKIPISLAQGEIPLVFIYDEQTEKLEPMLIQHYNSTSVTAFTRHFATSAIHAQGALRYNSSQVQAVSEFSSFFVSSLKESVLAAAGTISTGFAVGVDDWEFVNYGSYINPNGHCAGQSIGAMWYWYEKKSKTGEKLFNKFSDNPNLWQDNARGYRFCSMLQSDLLPQSLFTRFMRNTIRLDTNLDKIKFLTTAGALYVTHEPLYISIAFEDGVDTDNKPKYAGHALVCYGVSMNEQKLLISDPNTPNNAQSIELVNDHFKPYQSKLDGNASNMMFPFITPMAKTALIDWSKIEPRYTELLNATIGNGRFPAYTVYVKATPDDPLTDNYVTTNDTLRLYTHCPTAEWGADVDGKRRILTTIYNTDGNALQVHEGSNLYRVQLREGENKLGVFIESNVGPDAAHKTQEYIDFKWITVQYKKVTLDINPSEYNGIVSKDNTWNAIITNLPNNKEYAIVWNFGDGSPEQKVENNATISYKYESTGNFSITAKLIEKGTNRKIAEATAKATITGTGLEITSIYPTKERVGKDVTINGKLFGATQGSKVIYIGNVSVTSVKSWSDTRIVFTIPSGAVSGLIRIKSGTTFSNGIMLTVVPELKITAITPNTASEGNTITITGTGLAREDNSTVQVFLPNIYGSMLSLYEADYIKHTDTEISFTIPTGAGSGNVYVTNSYGYVQSNKLWLTLAVDVSVYKYVTLEPDRIQGTFIDEKGNSSTDELRYVYIRAIVTNASSNGFKAEFIRDTTYTDKNGYTTNIYVKYGITGTLTNDSNLISNVKGTKYSKTTTTSPDNKTSYSLDSGYITISNIKWVARTTQPEVYAGYNMELSCTELFKLCTFAEHRESMTYQGEKTYKALKSNTVSGVNSGCRVYLKFRKAW